MTIMLLGILLWTVAHFFKRILPGPRAAMGKMGRPIMAVLIVASVIMMIVGYREAETEVLYTLPIWAWYANNVLMLVAIFLMDAGRVEGVVRTKLRHPMLTGVIVWSVAHLLVNGDSLALILFGALGLWAFVEMVIINAAEGPWEPPAKGSVTNDVKIAAIATVIYAVIVGIHYWLGYPVLVYL